MIIQRQHQNHGISKRSSFGPGHGFPITPMTPLREDRELDISENNSSMPHSKMDSRMSSIVRAEEADIIVDKLLKP